MKVDEIKNREDAITFVQAIGSGDRQLNYGKPEDNFNRIAQLQKVYRDLKINKDMHTPTDVALEMILMKVARLMNNPKHMDSAVDIIGYALCLIDIITESNTTSDDTAPQKETVSNTVHMDKVARLCNIKTANTDVSSIYCVAPQEEDNKLNNLRKYLKQKEACADPIHRDLLREYFRKNYNIEFYYGK